MGEMVCMAAGVPGSKALALHLRLCLAAAAALAALVVAQQPVMQVVAVAVAALLPPLPVVIPCNQEPVVRVS
jgi:hypothetical protein